MAAGRKQLILELRATETRLEAQWERVQENSEARLDYLRRAHPGWLIGGGFVSGVVVERMLALWAGSAMASRLVYRGMRLWPLLSGMAPLGFLAGKPAP